MSIAFSRFHLRSRTVWTALLAGLAVIAIHGCLNQAWVSQLAGGSVVPLAPGDTPFVQVLVINATSGSTLDFRFGWTPEFQGFSSATIAGVGPEQQHGFLLGCPIDQIGLGNPDDLSIAAMTVTNEDGVTYDIPPAAFPLVLVEGQDYACGDAVVFTVIDDRTNGYGISVLPGRVDGDGQTGPFTGPDTFELVQALLQASGTPAIPVP